MPSFTLILILFAIVMVGIASTSAYFLDTSRLELQISPQTNTASGAVKVTSNSARKIRLRVLPKLWKLNTDGVLVYQEPPKEGFNLIENIGINPREFDLLPGKTRQVRFVVKSPEPAQNAEYAFQLYFEPMSLLENPNNPESTNVNNVLDVIPVFTTTVYVYQGNPKPDVQVERFTCDYDAKRSLFDVNLALRNQGAKHARLFGNLVISPETENTPQKPLDVLHMQNSTLIIVFPGAERIVQNKLAPATISKLEPGGYQMDLQLIDERNVQPAVQSTCHFTVKPD